MMRLGRRATLLVAFYLLASAATAYAESAWVLWNEVSSSTSRPDSSSSLILIGGWPTYQQCEQGRSAKAKSILIVTESDKGPNVVRVTAEENGNIITRTNHLKDGGNFIVSYRLTCLPDTVDPRGPKGK
jgi:hypothetical protein